MKKLLFLLLFFAAQTRAQTGNELNIGFHANPIFTTPIVSGSRSVRSQDLKVGKFRPGYNVGFNINYRLREFSIELAANYLHKSVSMYHRVGAAMTQNSYYRVNINSKSLEFPLLVNFLLARHDKNTTYDAYLQLGAAYEIAFFRNDMSSSTTSTAASELVVAGGYTGPEKQHIIAPVLGFKINANVRGLGLVDYGLGVHFPVGWTGEYRAEAKLTSGASNTLFSTSLYTSNAYIDLKLCYYFLSIGKGMKRVRYRN